MNYEKYIKDGKVAVLYSPGFGAGWYTWNTQHRGLLFDRDLVEPLLAGKRHEVQAVAERKYPDAYLGGLEDLEVMWLDQGSQFEVEEYDGNETVHVIGTRSYHTA